MYTDSRPQRTVIYQTSAGVEPYSEFVGSMKDRVGAAKILARVRRAGMGNLGDHRGVGSGVIELRIHSGPGYRVYLGLDGKRLVVLLGAGDKAGQAADIRDAVEAWADYKRNK